ncbi:PP2C family protein-serine/threonine phosphatase [Chryseomicrobium sp. FSL W7-1435]|uniref:PP2C family protein-serine/threonine phosphatase n=1 Tax=Chryseomicrobium sp. FSL W7-1435 TaxID=2921704 RepID=UPI00315A69C4
MPQEVERQYKAILRNYLEQQNELNLYEGQTFSKQLIQKNISPEEMIGIHRAALEEVVADIPDTIDHSFDLLIEVMVRYGLALHEHQNLIQKQENFRIEMDLAANVQKTLLKTTVPYIEGLDIGMLSVPAREMNGDYVHFLSNPQAIGIGIADVIGKGIPAALCMSMIKNGMDSVNSANEDPSVVLDVINRIVERSVTDSMFVSMLYASYDTTSNTFTYASAGHEPALHYSLKEETFHELFVRGLLLGVLPQTTYQSHIVQLEIGDFVVMMTDGVTECRSQEGFIEIEKVMQIIEDVKNESAQEMVEYVYKELILLQDFELRDDFTLVIVKRAV